MFLVKLEKNCWLADWEGDPGRTTVEENAKEFKTFRSAKMALKKALKYREFKNNEILEVQF